MLSHMRDTTDLHLEIRDVATRATGREKPVDRAKRYAYLQRLSGDALRAALDECLEAGLSWREIGAGVGIPFQTLQRQHAKGGPIILQAGGAR